MGLVHALASCLDCGWQATTLNAQGLGAKHHYKTGHQVMTEVCFSKTFLRSEPKKVGGKNGNTKT